MQETRRAIMNILKERSQATVDQLSEELKLTPVTIRHHLDILRSEGLVDVPQVRHRQMPGRPQHVYVLTERASEYFPKNYANFAHLTLLEVRERVGPSEVESIARGVARRMAAEAPHPLLDESIPQRLERVVSFLNEKGYVARWECSENGYLLHMSNCPYRGLVHTHAEPCVMDATLVAELIGAAPQRLSWMAAGGDMCTYLVPMQDGNGAG